MSITLLAFGGRAYALAASNMVRSLRHHGYAGEVHLHVTDAIAGMIDPGCRREATVHRLPDELAHDPGHCKRRLPSIIVDEATLFLDVDGIAMKDITPLVARLQGDGRPMLAQAAAPYVVGSGAKAEGHWWVTPELLVARAGLKEGDRVYAINTSCMWLRKGPELDELQRRVIATEDIYTRADLANKWGTAMPDELAYTTAAAQMGLDPSMPEVVCHFSKGADNAAKVAQAAYILPIYGSGRGNSTTPPHVRSLYDGQLRVMRGRVAAAPFGSQYIMRGKFVDRR